MTGKWYFLEEMLSSLYVPYDRSDATIYGGINLSKVENQFEHPFEGSYFYHFPNI